MKQYKKKFAVFPGRRVRNSKTTLIIKAFDVWKL